MNASSESIEFLLDAAERGSPGAAKEFFEALLALRVYVPLKRYQSAEEIPQNEILVPGKDTPYTFLATELNGNQTIPIFSRAEGAHVWAGADVELEETNFKSFIWLLEDTTWLYINPGQAVGKELSPWEIERLKQGTEAIDELVAELGQHAEFDVEIEAGRELYPELKTALKQVLEAYPYINEAFLLQMKSAVNEDLRGDAAEYAKQKTNEDFSLILGLKHDSASTDKLDLLKTEIQELVQRDFGALQELQFVDDLASPNCAHRRLFQDVTPFYFRTVVGSKSVGWFARLWKRIFAKN